MLRRHVLRAGLLPVVTMMGLQFAFMMGGAIVVENIFSWNGVGRMAVEAIFQRDYPVIQGFILTLLDRRRGGRHFDRRALRRARSPAFGGRDVTMATDMRGRSASPGFWRRMLRSPNGVVAWRSC